MQFTTLVSISALLTLSAAQDAYPTKGPSVTVCDILTTTKDPYDCPLPTPTCITLACLEIKPITQRCGCGPIETTKTCPTACPTSCGGTSYITAIEDCFPPPTSYPVTTPSPSKSYSNNTITKTETDITTITTCPESTTCTGQTVTYTSTEICPTTTCTCVLPSVTYITTNLPLPTTKPGSPPVDTTAPPAPPAVPAPSSNVTANPPPSPSPTVIEANGAVGGMMRRWSFEIGVGVLGGAFVAAMLGL